MLYLTIMSMEININCDLGEKSKHHSNKHDPELLEIVNSANVACGYHAGNEETMNQIVKISKKNGVSIGAHPSGCRMQPCRAARHEPVTLLHRAGASAPEDCDLLWARRRGAAR